VTRVTGCPGKPVARLAQRDRETPGYGVRVSEPRWLSDEEQKAWRKFAAVFTLLPASLDAQLQRDAALTHFAYFALAMLSEAPDRALRMSELAARSSSSPSRLSHTISRLENRGLVRRTRAAEDGRGQVAQLTDAGMAAIVEMAPGHVEAVQEYVFDALTPEQVQQLNEICTAVLSKIDPDGTLVPPPPVSNVGS
jgi:DNA-binding MarR family transcriptional regulator